MENYLFDGRWELKGCTHRKYILVNIYNGQKLEISGSQLERLKSGKDSVSHIITRKAIRNQTQWYDIDNGVINKMVWMKKKYGKKS